MDERLELLNRRLNRIFTGKCVPQHRVVDLGHGHWTIKKECGGCGGKHPDCITRPIPEVPNKSALEIFTECVYDDPEHSESTTPKSPSTLRLALKWLITIIQAGRHIVVRLCWLIRGRS
jgi:hypothetical protein